eukprot:8151336-Lingulodinium_polyedra.AAC.1
MHGKCVAPYPLEGSGAHTREGELSALPRVCRPSPCAGATPACGPCGGTLSSPVLWGGPRSTD